MPELPEVETTRRGIAPHIENQTITLIETRCEMLRHPLDCAALNQLAGKKITAVTRRGKHLILKTNDLRQALHLHLGMTGTLRIATAKEPYKNHDRVIIMFANGNQLRLHDPRKFGGCAVIDLENLPSGLKNLGPEPLSDLFNGKMLFSLTRQKRTVIKTLIMDQKFLLGVGNIYATEALFESNIHPARPACSLTEEECQNLVQEIKRILLIAIEQGGTTLKDFTSPDGNQGYFVQRLQVYGKAGLPCPKCKHVIEKFMQNGRTTAFCAHCQKWDFNK